MSGGDPGSVTVTARVMLTVVPVTVAVTVVRPMFRAEMLDVWPPVVTVTTVVSALVQAHVFVSAAPWLFTGTQRAAPTCPSSNTIGFGLAVTPTTPPAFCSDTSTDSQPMA